MWIYWPIGTKAYLEVGDELTVAPPEEVQTLFA